MINFKFDKYIIKLKCFFHTKCKSYNATTTMSFTQYYDSGMVLRSGKHINSIEHTDLYSDFIRMKNGLCLSAREDNNGICSHKYDHYDPLCYRAFVLFEYLEKYYETMRSNYFKIRYQLTLHNYFYKSVVQYINDVVRKLKTSNHQCSCRFNKIRGCDDSLLMMDYQILYNERAYNMSNDPSLVKMETYSGFAEKAKYRLYHMNYIHLVNHSTIDIEVAQNHLELPLIAQHDISRITKELLHWLRYFNNPRAYTGVKKSEIKAN